MHPFVHLMYRYVVDYLVGHDTSVCAQIMEPDYVLRMADATLGPRDEVYVPAVAAQLVQFPGMGMTVHDLWFAQDPNGVRAHDRLALLFSQHGASLAHGGAIAGWMGIGIYRWNGTMLTSNTAIEDYEGRREQLAMTTQPAVLPGPQLAPWDQAGGSASPAAEAALCSILSAPGWMLDPALRFDSGTGEPLQFDVEHTEITEMASCGERVAFAASVHGRYQSGLDVPTSVTGAPAVLHVMGMVTLADASAGTTSGPARLVSGHIIRGRGPLRRTLLQTAKGLG